LSAKNQLIFNPALPPENVNLHPSFMNPVAIEGRLALALAQKDNHHRCRVDFLERLADRFGQLSVIGECSETK
jgi:hypothetical protein